MPGYKLCEADKKHLCAECKLLVREAVQTACGHRFCSSCLRPRLTRGPVECNICGEVVSKKQVFPDRFADREILQLETFCVNHDYGCPWKGELRTKEAILHQNCMKWPETSHDYEEKPKQEKHEAVCEFSPVPCTYQECGKLMSGQSLPKHLQSECQYREENCTYCQQPVAVAKLKKHLRRYCRVYPQTFPHCDKELPSSEMTKHLDPTSPNPCESIESACPFSNAGCSENQPMTSKARKSHLQEAVANHVSILLDMIVELSRYVEDRLPQMITQPAGNISNLQELCDKAITGIEKVVSAFAKLSGKHNEHEARIAALERGAGASGIGGNMPVQHGVAQSSSRHSLDSSIEERLSRSLNSSETRSNEHCLIPQASLHSVALSKDAIRERQIGEDQHRATIEEFRRQVARLNNRVQEGDEVIRRLERRIDVQDQALGLRNLAIADHEERLNDLEGCSYDSVLIWKITQVAQKRTDARTGRVESFYSPCFFTGPHGYKMCARIHLNGDGMGKGTHVSVFFVMMRGEYDALLRWPFPHKVSITLVDQENQENNISDVFRPDPASSSFQRPRAEMNIASGCPLFCSHEQLGRNAYIRDDCMFIKVIVDKGE